MSGRANVLPKLEYIMSNIDLCHAAAILSQETQKALFMHSYPHRENEVCEVYEWGLCDVKLTMLMDSFHVHRESVNLI